MRALLIADDGPLADSVQTRIELDGHLADHVSDLASARRHLAAVNHELVVVDLALSGGRGLDFVRELRMGGWNAFVLILTELNQSCSRVAGRNFGADDCLIKPFELLELSERVRAVSRRYSNNANPSICIGNLRIDSIERIVMRGNVRTGLSANEWAVLEALIQNLGMIVPKRTLERVLHSPGAGGTCGVTGIHMKRLRQKLGVNVIESVPGRGYRIRR